MEYPSASIVLIAGVLALSACSRKAENATNAPASTGVGASAATQPAAAPTQASAPPEAAPPAQTETAPLPAKPKPPAPKKYVIAAGTPISVRTTGGVNTKSSQSGNEFEATLESPLTVDGRTLAKRGATVIGKVVNADKGGRVKGKASLTLALSSLSLANGQTVPIATNSVSQAAKSGTKKNLMRTGVASGAGAAIGAIAGGGKGAAIGAGIGAGAGVATNMATRGPAAEVPAETVLNFSLAKDVVVIEK